MVYNTLHKFRNTLHFTGKPLHDSNLCFKYFVRHLNDDKHFISFRTSKFVRTKNILDNHFTASSAQD